MDACFNYSVVLWIFHTFQIMILSGQQILSSIPKPITLVRDHNVKFKDEREIRMLSMSPCSI